MNKKLPQRIKNLLDSDDLELVQLGANVLPQYYPEERWSEVLNSFMYKKFDEDNVGNLYIPKWTYTIDNHEISISAPFMFEASYTYTYNTPQYYVGYDGTYFNNVTVGGPGNGTVSYPYYGTIETWPDYSQIYTQFYSEQTLQIRGSPSK